MPHAATIRLVIHGLRETQKDRYAGTQARSTDARTADREHCVADHEATETCG
eukprot:COSAG01_NODE_39970_length_469_cov_1.935135_1_plen_51_part_10